MLTFDITDSEGVLINDRMYYSIDDGAKELIQNRNTNEKALFIECNESYLQDAIRNFENEVLSDVGNTRGFRNIVYPQLAVQNAGIGEEPEYYVFTELPDSYNENAVHQLSKALTVNRFSIYSRIMAAINIAESLSVLKEYIGKCIQSIRPEEIYINTENGEVYIWIEKWLCKYSEKENAEEFGFSPEWYESEEKVFTETDFRFFTAYVIFRLLCSDEPFDGSGTLVEFPLLTKEAIRSIQCGRYGFALVPGKNSVSEYIGQGLLKRWRALPLFVRNEFEKSFTLGISSPGDRTEISTWLKTMRKMRDCLVFVNGQVRFCDPDVNNKVLFMVIDDYKIPVWPKKAVYWYHTDAQSSEKNNGVIAGVTSKDGRYYLKNLSGSVWTVTLDKTSNWIQPEQEIEIVEGMTIQLENNKLIRIVNGMISDPVKAADVTVQDVKSADVTAQDVKAADVTVQDVKEAAAAEDEGTCDTDPQSEGGQNPENIDYNADGKEE